MLGTLSVRRVRRALGRVLHCKVEFRPADRIVMAASMLWIAALVDAVVVWFARQWLQMAVELLCQGDVWALGIAPNSLFSHKWLPASIEGTSSVRRVRLMLGFARARPRCGDRRGMAAISNAFARSSCVVFCNSLNLCRSPCNGCVKVAWCCGCVRNTIVFCSWTS